MKDVDLLYGWCITSGALLAVGLMLGVLLGQITADEVWRNRCADNPDYIAAVRSEILATRNRIEMEK